MKLVVQRVLNSKVEVEGNVVGQIEKGLWFCVESLITIQKKRLIY